MPETTKTELINDPEVRQEIDRYKWVESEKVGADIGFERAAKEWMTRFSEAWLKSRRAPENKPSGVTECKTGTVLKKPGRKAKKS